MDNWVEVETATTDMNDKRLNQRLKHILNAISEQPQESLSAVCEDLEG